MIDCVVMKNSESGRSRGFGFVTFADPANVDVVLRSGPHVLDSRTVSHFFHEELFCIPAVYEDSLSKNIRVVPILRISFIIVMLVFESRTDFTDMYSSRVMVSTFFYHFFNQRYG